MHKEKNAKTFVLALLLCAACLISCKVFGSKSSSYNNSNNSNNSNTVSNENDNSTTTTARDCPSGNVNVSTIKSSGGLDAYVGCTLSIAGKLWEVRNETVTLIDVSDRTDYNGALYCGGNFTSSSYYSIASKISDIKLRQEYDRLPVVTFTATVRKSSSGYAGLTDCILTDVQQR